MAFQDKPANLPALYIKSTPVELPEDFKITDALALDGMAFIFEGQGMVGRGAVLTLTASGSDRIQNLASQWRELCTKAVFDGGATKGKLLAFGAIAFDSQSAVTSTLTVPRQVLSLKNGKATLTNITTSRFETPKTLGPEWFAPLSPQKSINLVPGAVSEARFESLVESALQRIDAGQVEKVVVARDVTAKIPRDFDPRQAITRLTKRYPSCWTYWVNKNFGASPELLIRVANRQINARVLAGSAARGTDPSIDEAIATALKASAKNSHEHRLAVESLVASLSGYCANLDADPEPFSLALPNLWHLASDVRGTLDHSNSALDVLAALHPTAAVAGTPLADAQAAIRELEPFDRGVYAGPVGWIDSTGDGEWVIALRGATIGQGSITAMAGCGIVAGSDPAAELAETELKLRPIRQALA